MIDEPPIVQVTNEPLSEGDAAAALPTELRPDGTLVIDLMPLAPPPTQCATEEPDPLNPEIIVCRETSPSARLGPGALVEVDDFGNAIPRARIRLSDDAEAQANATSTAIGGFPANGVEARIKIDF